MSTTQLLKFISAVSIRQQSRHQSLLWPCTKSVLSVVRLLKAEGYIHSFHFANSRNNTLEVILSSSKPPFYPRKTFTPISHPSISKYFSSKDAWRFSSKLSLLLLSTPKGVLSAKTAKLLKVGGKALFCSF
jgi:small subunit ribosomal protein S8